MNAAERIDLAYVITGAEMENDLDALSDLLCRHEQDNDIRYVIHAAIDRVAANLERPIVIDEVRVL